MNKYLIVVDTQNDFITGSLACQFDDRDLISKIQKLTITFAKGNVFYTLDYHSLNHISLKRNGGIWPDHCIQKTDGASLHQDLFSTQINCPDETNMFYKGQDDTKEEYSGFNATSINNTKLSEIIPFGSEVYIVGFAVEYCCFETAKEFANAGYKTHLLTDYCGYVTSDGKKEVFTKQVKNLEIV